MSTISASQPLSNATQTLTGADVFVECLIRQGTDVIFAYPGGCSMPLHQSLTHRSADIRTILPRHEQGGAFAAQGVSRTTDRVGVCMGTSGPGATNLVTAIADAKMDSIPLIAISAQVPTPDWQRCLSGNADGRNLPGDHETPLPGDEDGRYSTNHQGSVPHRSNGTARTGVDRRAKDVQLNLVTWEVDYDPEMNLLVIILKFAAFTPNQIRAILKMIRESKKPIFYAGGGIIQANASEEFTKFARKTGIPVATTVMGIGLFSWRR